MGIVAAVIVGLIIYGVMHGEGAGTLDQHPSVCVLVQAHVVPMITGTTISLLLVPRLRRYLFAV